VRNFDKLANLIWEKQKVRLDPKCWKGKKLGTPKTKMKGGVRVNNCVPAESIGFGGTAKYKILASFNELPDNPPHGFWVTKDGKFIVVPYMWGHDEAIKALFPDLGKGAEGSRLQMNALKAGLLRMARLGYSNVYGLTYHPLYTGPRAIKTAKDIAEFYNMEVKDDFEGL
jgi:hypothetical protein